MTIGEGTPIKRDPLADDGAKRHFEGTPVAAWHSLELLRELLDESFVERVVTLVLAKPRQGGNVDMPSTLRALHA